jgi:hypothetical protein
MEPRDLIRKLTAHKKDPSISKLIVILELCEMNRLPLDYIEDLLTFEETRLLSIITRSILRERGKNIEKIITDKPMDELMGLFRLLVV